MPAAAPGAPPALPGAPRRPPAPPAPGCTPTCLLPLPNSPSLPPFTPSSLNRQGDPKLQEGQQAPPNDNHLETTSFLVAACAPQGGSAVPAEFLAFSEFLVVWRGVCGTFLLLGGAYARLLSFGGAFVAQGSTLFVTVPEVAVWGKFLVVSGWLSLGGAYRAAQKNPGASRNPCH
jgi:hypothetical protein